MDEWPFDQRRDCAVIALRSIAEGNAPILHVSHNLDDHGWQFLGWDEPGVEDAVTVCLQHIVDLDASVRELGDLPPGWHAWRRQVADPWTREVNPHAAA